MLEKLKGWIIDIQEEALSEKKRKAREKGDESRWRSEIWSSPNKNKAIKLKLIEEGKRLRYNVRSSESHGEWLYDLVWREYDSHNNLISIPLAVEIEMSDSTIGGVIYDFNKLLQADAAHKLMVFQAKLPADIESTFSRITQSIQAYPAGAKSNYLICGWCTSENRFHFMTSEAYVGSTVTTGIKPLPVG